MVNIHNIYFTYNVNRARIPIEIIKSRMTDIVEEEKSMGMTMTQKILAAHAGLSEVKAGQLIEADLDLTLQRRWLSVRWRK